MFKKWFYKIRGCCWGMFYSFSLNKVAIQSLLTASVQNIKKLLKHFAPELQNEARVLHNFMQVLPKIYNKIQNSFRLVINSITNNCLSTSSYYTLPQKTAIKRASIETPSAVATAQGDFRNFIILSFPVDSSSCVNFV